MGSQVLCRLLDFKVSALDLGLIIWSFWGVGSLGFMALGLRPWDLGFSFWVLGVYKAVAFGP